MRVYSCVSDLVAGGEQWVNTFINTLRDTTMARWKGREESVSRCGSEFRSGYMKGYFMGVSDSFSLMVESIREMVSKTERD